MNLVTVIPFTRIPRSEPQTYTYFSSLAVPPGGIVEASLGRRAVPALVCKVTRFSVLEKTTLRQAKFTLKPLSKVLVPWPVVDEITLKFIPAAAEAIVASLGLIANLCVPKALLTVRRPVAPFQWPAQVQKNEELFHYRVTFGPRRIEKLIEIIAAQLENSSTQVLILTPSIERINFWQNALAHFQKTIGIYSSNQSASQRLGTAIASANSSTRLIVGTRGAIFLSIPRLCLIVIDEENSDGHRSWESQPLYDARDLAVLKARLAGATLVASSSYPSVKTAYSAAECVGAPFTTPIYIERLTQSPERPGEWPIFMPSVKKTLSATLAQGGKALMYLNRRGEAPLTVCRVCGFVPRCPDCRLPLTRHKCQPNESRFLCHTCGREFPLPLRCPNCAKGELKVLGIGTQTLEAHCRTLWPNVGIWRLDAETAREKTEIIKKLDAAPGPAILIGTATVLSYPGSVTLAIAPRIDTDVLFPSYDAQEQTFLKIGKLTELAAEGVFIQTITPNLGVLRLAQKHDYNTFYSREIQMRAILGFPPAIKLVKATFAARRPEKANGVAHTVAEKLKTAFAFWQKQHTRPPMVSILGPLRGYRAFAKGLYCASIILKFQLKETDLERYLLDFIPADWRIEINPPNILA